MIKKIGFIWIFVSIASFSYISCQRNILITINEIPDTTTAKDTLYFASSMNNWQPNVANYHFTPQKNGTYLLQLSDVKTPFEYKITRGSWETVETTLQGEDIQNRNGHPKDKTINIAVKGWSDNHIKTSTQLPNVRVVNDAFPMTKLNTTRRIWICLPTDYETSTERYPVLYMHDGQNLFDVLTSYSGEWEVDETMQRLEKEQKLKIIIVGIDNSDNRNSEYTPYPNVQYGGGQGAAYADFVVNELKPFIDKNYRTKSDRANTGIMGSSLGGVISMYIGTEYAETFGKLGLFSPAFWWSEKSYEQVENKGFVSNTKIYMNAGLDESPLITEGTTQMEKTLKKVGYSDDHLMVNYVEGGTHSESFWKEEFPKAVLWLFE